MTHVATLVANPARPVLEARLVASVAQLLPDAQTSWLAPGIAADLAFAPPDNADASRLAALLRAAVAGEPVDVIVQPAAGRRKKLLVADMDSTVIAQECIDELADFAGLKEHVAKITARAMRGEIEFVSALRERVALLAGLDVGVIDKLLAERITPTPGAAALVATMRAHGAFTALVTGGFTQFTLPLAERLGFHTSEANMLIVENGKLTGEITEPVRGQFAKRDALKRLCVELGLSASETLAAGDGTNDIAMLAEAGFGVAFHAQPAVAAVAAARIDHADLTALLYAQGYRREEFCSCPPSS
ncbi:MAG: phosphoserine phosphatase SerB [Methylovirgula sp.]